MDSKALLDSEAETLTRRALQAAIMGDILALRLCLERVLSPRRDNPVAFTLPPMTTARDVAGAAAAVLQVVCEGELTAREGTQVMALVDSERRTLETVAHLHPLAPPSTTWMLEAGSWCPAR